LISERVALVADLLACPRCAGSLEASATTLECRACGASHSVENEIPDLRVAPDARTAAVREFYTVAPFPGYPPKMNLSGLRARAERSELARLLDRAIPGDARIVEVGCGTGQMSLFLATAHRVVVGADLTRASLALGATAAARYGLDRVCFVETDLNRPGLLAGAFDVVYTSGVLHHTPDPRAAFASVARLAKPGGIVVLGLYNTYARIPHRLRRALARCTGYKFVPFDPVLRLREGEPARREAWLRDQYLHPEEHRHSIGEVKSWFSENGVRYLRTYPNALIGADQLEGDELFSAAEDDWSFEDLLSQLAWAKTLWSEGGLWVTVGQREAS
jgi:SAM-dependent methyltransferase